MCGIVGWVEFNGEVRRDLFDRMRDTLAHRGPDGAGTRLSEDGRFALGHRRLAFLDLTETGLQPMGLEDEGIWVSLNGEIYNYRELRAELENKGRAFRTRTDTEVLLHGYAVWGIERLLSRLRGMFAFGLFDEKNGQLHLVRDRFGIKPLYYHHDNYRLIFASELKAIMVSGMVPKEVDMCSLSDYFVYRYVPSPNTIWKNISKLPPAHRLEVNLRNNRSSMHEYWHIGYGNKRGSADSISREVSAVFTSSVTEHSRSDVEVGSFLSGGYDSSAILLEMSGNTTSVKAFTLGFEDWDNSEDRFASIVAEHLRADLKSMRTDSSMLDLLPLMAEVYDEPLADISTLPTYLLSRLAARSVKAVMSGEGADEVFGGYAWQKAYFSRWHRNSTLQWLSERSKKRQQTAVGDYADFMAMGRFDRKELGAMLQPDHRYAVRDDVEWFYRSHYAPGLSPLRSVQHMDIKCFMGELVLPKIDRASMACSLEVRVPFLDHRIIETVFGFREQDCFSIAETKLLLNRTLKGRLPGVILQRPKQGFVGPESLYSNLPFYRSLLLGGALVSDGIVKSSYVQQLLQQSDHWRLWKLAVMEHWWQRWIR